MNIVRQVDEAPPWLNVLITAGFHTAHCAVWQLTLGWGVWCALFLYTFREIGPYFSWLIRGRRGKPPYEPSAFQVDRGWTRAWVVVDQVADAAGPWAVALFLG